MIYLYIRVLCIIYNVCYICMYIVYTYIQEHKRASDMLINSHIYAEKFSNLVNLADIDLKCAKLKPEYDSIIFMIIS